MNRVRSLWLIHTTIASNSWRIQPHGVVNGDADGVRINKIESITKTEWFNVVVWHPSIHSFMYNNLEAAAGTTTPPTCTAHQPKMSPQNTKYTKIIWCFVTDELLLLWLKIFHKRCRQKMKKAVKDELLTEAAAQKTMSNSIMRKYILYVWNTAAHSKLRAHLLSFGNKTKIQKQNRSLCSPLLPCRTRIPDAFV